MNSNNWMQRGAARLATVALVCLLGMSSAFAVTRGEVEAKIKVEQEQLAKVVATEGENSSAAGDLMFSLGSDLSDLGRYPEARDMYLRGVKNAIAQKGEGHAYVAGVKNNLAGVYDDMGQYEEARKLYTEVVESFFKYLGGKHKLSLRAVNSLAGVLGRLGQFEKAQKAYEFALPRRIEVHGEESREAMRTRAGLARILMVRGQYAEANKYMKQIVEIYSRTRDANDDETLGAKLDVASSFNEMGDYQSALALVQQVMDARIAKFGPKDPRVTTAKAQLANVMINMGRFADGLRMNQEVYEERRTEYGEDDDATLLALGNLGYSYESVGRYVDSLKTGLQVATIREKKDGPNDVSTLLAWLSYSVSLGKLGRYSEAGHLQERVAKGLTEKIGQDSPMFFAAVSQLAATLYDVGEWQRAADMQRFVLAGRTKLLGPDHRDTLGTRHNLALNLIKLKQLDEARKTLEEAVSAIEKVAPLHAAMADLPYYYRTLGETYVAMGDKVKARDTFRRGLAMAETTMGPDHPLTGYLANFLASTEPVLATRVDLYNRALRIGQSASQPDIIWRATDGLRASYEQMGHPAVAIMYGKRAINTLQNLRAGLADLDKSMQKAFLGDKRQVYTELADLLIGEGRLAEGQQVMALLKQDEYFEFVSRAENEDPNQSKLTLNTQETAWFARYNAVSDRLVEVSKRKAALDAKARTGALSDEEKAEKSKIEGDLQAARQAFDAASKQIVEDAKRYANARGGDQKLGSEVIDSVRAMRGDLRQLGNGAVLVHYLMAEDKVWIMVTTPEVQVARESKVKSADLNRKIDAFRTVLRNPKSDPRPLARELYTLLIGPIAKDLAQAQAKTLMLSLDGALRYVPFGALHDGNHYIVEDFRLAIFTEAAKSRIKDVPQAEWTMTGLGLTKAVQGFSALPAVREELRGIVRTSNAPGATGVMAGQAVLDEAFTVERVKAALDEGRPVLHIASHFKFTPGTEADSYLVMGDGGHLSLQQIRQDDFQFNVDLLTLSACETAVGDNARGQEVEGLGALAQKQGAKAVLATLWPVADASTGIFMREMYRLRADGKLTKAEAIRQVQVAFEQGKLTGTSSSLADRGATAQGARQAEVPGAVAAQPSTGYSHPFYWAPFILMGNWL